MIEETAVVLRVDQGNTYLEIVRNSPCGLCGQTRGCGISIWGRLLGHHQSEFTATNEINAQVGDSVVVGVEESALLVSSFVAYGMPLLALLAGAMAGVWLAPQGWGRDMASILGAVSGFGLGLLWLKVRSVRRGQDAHYKPVILRPAENSAVRVCRGA